jgi:hypothetical protein
MQLVDKFKSDLMLRRDQRATRSSAAGGVQAAMQRCRPFSCRYREAGRPAAAMSEREAPDRG